MMTGVPPQETSIYICYIALNGEYIGNMKTPTAPNRSLPLDRSRTPSLLPSRTCHLQHRQVQRRKALPRLRHGLGAAVHGQDAALVPARQQGAGDAWRLGLVISWGFLRVLMEISRVLTAIFRCFTAISRVLTAISRGFTAISRF